MNVLSPLKYRQDNRIFWGFDVETINNGLTFLSTTFYHSEIRKFFFPDKRAAIGFMQRKPFAGTILVATNMAYDFAALITNEPEEMEFRLCTRSTRIIEAKSYITNKGFKKYQPENEHRARQVSIWDTMNFAMQGVEKLGGMLNIKKIEAPPFLGFGKNAEKSSRLPATVEEWEMLMHYNMRDAEISKKFMEYLKEHLAAINCPLGMTIASTAMRYYRINHLDRKYYQPEEEELLRQFEAYYGGRTEVIERGEFENVNYYDINSLYPAMMAFNNYPDINTIRHIYGDTQKYIDAYEGYSEVTVECPKDMKLPLLPYRSPEGKLIFPTGRFTARYTHVELRRERTRLQDPCRS